MSAGNQVNSKSLCSLELRPKAQTTYVSFHSVNGGRHDSVFNAGFRVHGQGAGG